jgi:sulfite reductase (ferredoxin)
LERIAQLSKTYGNGVVHVTTRQDIQIHEVKIEDTPAVLESLLEAGLSPRGGGGNTVRNVTACPRTGVCPKEEFDVAPYAIATAEYLLPFKSSYNLPRKYKIVFSGCSADCAFASVADLGFFAHLKEGIKGFSVYAGGGLGSNPAVAVKIEEFITDNEFLEVAEVIKRMFDKYGDRSNKHKARLRYVLRRFGAKEFVKLYNDERAELHKQGLQGEKPEVRDIASRFEFSGSTSESDKQSPLPNNVLPEKAEGLLSVRLVLNLGDIPADDLIKVGQIAENFGQGLVRTTQLQDLLVTGIPRENLENVKSALDSLSINAIGNNKPRVVACTGAATCKLGLCLSRGLADAISEKFGKNDIQQSETTIKISGCPNSCGHHYIGNIGFQGNAKRVNGRLMPCYDILVGARTVEGDARLAERIGTVPARKIPDLLAEAFETGATEKQQLKTLVQRYSDSISAQFPDDYYYDYGSEEPFSLAGRGPGECGAGVMDVIKLDIDEAREAVKTAHQTQATENKSESVYKALVAAARALLVAFGIEPKKDREIFAAFSEHIIKPGWVIPQAQQLLDDAIDWRMGDKNSIDDLVGQTEALAKRVEELFLSLDANLKFRVKPVTQKQNSIAPGAETKNRLIDLRGVACPLNFVKAKLELEKISVGEILEMLLDDGEPVRNAPASFAEQGQEVIEVKSKDDHFCVKVRRKK